MWVGLSHNIMILGLVALRPGEFITKILYRKQKERPPERLSYIVYKLYFGVICGLIDNSLHGKNYNFYTKPYTFYRQGKVFYKHVVKGCY